MTDPRPVLTVYIAGPMSGYPEWNFPAFFDAERRLLARGYAVANPARYDRDQLGFDPTTDMLDTVKNKDYFLRESLRWDFEQLTQADAIHMLAGWEASKGATAEKLIAEKLGLQVITITNDDSLADYIDKQGPEFRMAVDRVLAGPCPNCDGRDCSDWSCSWGRVDHL
jgi:hypothetical protein